MSNKPNYPLNLIICKTNSIKTLICLSSFNKISSLIINKCKVKLAKLKDKDNFRDKDKLKTKEYRKVNCLPLLTRKKKIFPLNNNNKRNLEKKMIVTRIKTNIITKVIRIVIKNSIIKMILKVIFSNYLNNLNFKEYILLLTRTLWI